MILADEMLALNHGEVVRRIRGLVKTHGVEF